jgi:HAD superfamily hydrolase (TIGR01490 family)
MTTAAGSRPDVLAIFDLGHTLLPLDADEQWIDFLIARGRLDRAEYDSGNRDLMARYKRGEAGALDFTEFYLSTFARFAPEELEALRDAFVRERVAPSITRAARDIVDKHRRLGHMTVLTTATSRFVTEPVARELGFAHHIATDGEMRDGRFTGRVIGTPNMREGKVDRLQEWLATQNLRLADFRESWFYSDSQNDLPLLSHVTHPVAVNADDMLAAHARLRGWPQIHIGDRR